MSIAPLLLLASLSLMFIGLVLLIEREHDVQRELSPAELSTSAPVPRPCWARIQERVWPWRSPSRRRRRASGSRAVVLETAEISAGRTVFCGRVADLGSRPGAWDS